MAPPRTRAADKPLVDKPLVLVTGAAGDIGTALSAALARHYRVVGLDRNIPGQSAAASDNRIVAGPRGTEQGDERTEWVTIDLSDDASVNDAITEVRRRFGSDIAAVVHLAAVFDFTGEDNPLYQQVNVEGTRRLLRALRACTVERFVYSGTMLVHRPCRPGERIDESAPIEPKWAYPKSKAAAEQAIVEEIGSTPYALLHLAGLYDDDSAVPTLAQQIARIYERDIHSHLYAGDQDAGQSMLHREDMIDAFRRVIDRRASLPPELTLLVGEPDAIGYGELQRLLGKLIHGRDDWQTIDVPAPIAKAGAWLEAQVEPLVPDAIDHGEKPFIRPFMIDMASDHYALDIARARSLLGWEPHHRLRDTLPTLVAGLKHDPIGWYQRNGITPPAWLQTAAEASDSPEALRARAGRRAG